MHTRRTLCLRSSVLFVLLVLLVRAETAGQGLPEFVYFSSIGRSVGNAISSWQSMVANTAALSRDISAARRAFWESYSDGPGHAAAAEGFSQLLATKDALYTFFELNYQARTTPNSRNQIPRQVAELVLQGGTIDGGIPGLATPAFGRFHGALLENAERRTGGDFLRLFSPDVLTRVWDDSRAEYDDYVALRNISEFIRAGREPVTPDARSYALWIIYPYAGGGFDEVEERYAELVSRFGRARVERAFDRVRAAPKVRRVGEECRFDFCVADPGALGVVVASDSDQLLPADAKWASSASPAQVVSALLTPDDPLAYAEWVLTHRLGWWTSNRMFLEGPVEAPPARIREGQGALRRAVSRYGEQRVRGVAARLRDAPKTLRGEVADLRGLGLVLREERSTALLPEGLELVSSVALNDVFRALLRAGTDDPVLRARALVEAAYLPGGGMPVLGIAYGDQAVTEVLRRVGAARLTLAGALADPSSIGVGTVAPALAVLELLAREDPLGWVKQVVVHASQAANSTAADPVEETFAGLVAAAGSEDALATRAREYLAASEYDLFRIGQTDPVQVLRSLRGDENRAPAERIAEAMREFEAYTDQQGLTGLDRADYLMQVSNGAYMAAATDEERQANGEFRASHAFQQLESALLDFFFAPGIRNLPDERRTQLQANAADLLVRIVSEQLDPLCAAGGDPVSRVACLRVAWVRYMIAQFPDLVPQDLPGRLGIDLDRRDAPAEGPPAPAAAAAFAVEPLFADGGEGEEPALLNAGEMDQAFRSAVPAGFRGSGLEATMIVRLTIGADGSVRNWEIVQLSGSGAALFVEVGSALLDSLRFSPALQGGSPVEVERNYQIRMVAPAP